MKVVHIARPVYQEEDFGKLTYCGVVCDDYSAKAPSQIKPTEVCHACHVSWAND